MLIVVYVTLTWVPGTPATVAAAAVTTSGAALQSDAKLAALLMFFSSWLT